MRLTSLFLVLCTFLAACGPEALPTRSTRRPDAGDGDTGDGDTGDGDTGDGDGDGDSGDGDGDGDLAGFLDIESKLVPLPDGVMVSDDDFAPPPGNVVHLSDEGHVLLEAFIESEGEYVPFVWRGGAAPPERVVLPAEYEYAYPVCMLDGDRIIVSYLAETTRQMPVLIEGASATVYEVPPIVSDDDFLAIEYCNSAGQVLARTASGTWVLGSGAPVNLADSNAEPLGLNDSAHALFADGYWDGTKFVGMLEDKFKPYSGPSNAGVMLGSYDELVEMLDYAVFWDPSDPSGELIKLPLLPVSGVPVGPMLIGPNGDALVGTSIRSEPNTVYLYRDGQFALIGVQGEFGVQGETIGEIVNINAEGQVLTEMAFTSTDDEHIGILFTPRN